MKTSPANTIKILVPIFLILLTPLVSALEFYPSSITIALEPNEQACRTVFFELDNPVTISDEWASDPSVLWSVSYFNTPAEQHEIQISYPEEVPTSETQTQFCISGSQPGQYRGALVFRQQREGNSIVQFAIWIQLTISGSEQETPTPQQNQTDTSSDDDDSSSSSNSRSSGSSSRSDISNQISNVLPLAEPLSYTPPAQPEEIQLQNTPIVENNRNVLVLLSASTTILVAVFLIILLAAKKPMKK